MKESQYALDVDDLDEQYANGEITKAAYNRLMRELDRDYNEDKSDCQCDH